MTAHWEHQLQAMAQQQAHYGQFMEALTSKLDQLLNHIKHNETPQALYQLKTIK